MSFLTQPMKLSIAAALLSLPLISFFVFSTREESSPGHPAVLPDAPITASDLAADKEIEKYSAPSKKGVLTDDAQKQVAEMRAKTDALGRAAAILITEDVQRGMVINAMKRRMQVYQPLFDKWASGDAEMEAVLDVIRRREARLISLRTEAQKKGSVEVLKSIPVIDSERAVYAEELRLILDADKMREFDEIDTQENNRFRVKLPARD